MSSAGVLTLIALLGFSCLKSTGAFCPNPFSIGPLLAGECKTTQQWASKPARSPMPQVTMQERRMFQSNRRGKTGYGRDLSTDFVRRERQKPRGPIPGDRRRAKTPGRLPGYGNEPGLVVKNGQLPKDLHMVNDLDVLVNILEAVAGVPPMPPTFPAPQSRDRPSPPTRAPQDTVDEQAPETTSSVAVNEQPLTSAGQTADVPWAETQAAREEELSGWKVADLKTLCKDNGLKVGGKKSELVDRILEFEAEALPATTESVVEKETGIGELSSDQDVDDMSNLSQEEFDRIVGFEEEADGAVSQQSSYESDLSQDYSYSMSDLDDPSPFGMSDDALDLFRNFGPIKYLSTRGHPRSRWRGRFGEAVREGIPVDGGLLVPHRFPDLRGFLPEWKGMPLSEIGARVSSMLLIREVQHGFLREVYQDAYQTFADPSNPTPLVTLTGSSDTSSSPSLSVLELFHGPTSSAEDLAMEPLARILSHQMHRRKGRLTAVVPWSPRRGGGLASVSALRAVPHSACFVLCPLDLAPSRALDQVLDLASSHQTSDDRRDDGLESTPAAVNQLRAVFLPRDDEGVSEIGAAVCREVRLRRQYGVTLFDSRNVGHVMLALTHVIWAVLEAQGDSDDEVVVAVEEGDGTQATAALYARLMGLPIKRVVVARREGSIKEEEEEQGEERGLAGMERVAFELAGRDPGVMVEAEGDWEAVVEGRNGGSGLTRVTVTTEMVEAARSKFGDDQTADSTLCAVAGVEAAGEAEARVVVMATEAASAEGEETKEGASVGSEEEEEEEAGGAMGRGRRVLVGSAQSVTDFVAATLPPYRPFELHAPQLVAAMHHLKRLSSSARDKQHRRKSEDLMDNLMHALMAQTGELSVKDTSLALKVVSDEVRKTEAGAREARKPAETETTTEWALLLRLRARMEEHLTSGNERLSNHLLGLALNALTKAGKGGPALVAEILDASNALLLDRHPDAIDHVAMVHIATAFATAPLAPTLPGPDGAPGALPDVGIGVDLFQVDGEQERWRQYGRYGRLAMRMGKRLQLIDPVEFQPNAFPPLATLFARCGLLGDDESLRHYLDDAIHAIPLADLAAYPLVLCEIAESYLAAGLAREELCVRVSAAVPLLKPQFLTPGILCRLLDVLSRLHAAIPPPPPHPFLGDIADGHPWLREASQTVARLSTNLPPAKWTAPTLARFLILLNRARYSPPEPPFVAYSTVALKYLAAPPPPPSSFDAVSLAGLVRYYAEQELLAGDVLAALEEGAGQIGEGKEGGGSAEWRAVLVGAGRGGVESGVLLEESARRIEALMDAGEALPLSDLIPVLDVLSSSSAEYSEHLIEGILAAVVAESPTAIPPPLLCRLSKAISLQPASRSSTARALAHVEQAVRDSDPALFNPAHLAAIAASVARMQEQWPDDSDLDPTAVLKALSGQTTARASSLYTRHTARVILQAFMSAEMPDDPAVTHLERIAKGRPTLKADS